MNIEVESILQEEKIIIEQYSKGEDALNNIVLIPQFYPRDGINKAFAYDTVSFYKYTKIKQKYASIGTYTCEEPIPTLALHSNEIWLPVIWIASNILLPTTLNLISNYIWSRMSCLKGENHIVHFHLITEDKEGILKKIKYDGPIEGLEKIEKIINGG